MARLSGPRSKASPRPPRPRVGFDAPVRRDARLTAIVEVLERSSREVPPDELAAVLLDWSPGEYAEPPLAPAAIALTHAERLRLYELRAAQALSLFHDATRTRHRDSSATDTLVRLPTGQQVVIRCDITNDDAYGELMVRAPGQTARRAGWISLRIEDSDDDDDD